MPIPPGPDPHREFGVESVISTPVAYSCIVTPAEIGKKAVMVTLADIDTARRTIAGHVLRTPLLAAPPLSALTGAEIFVKYENLQVTNSFKERGACVKLAALSAEQRRRGVIAMSAGNHALGSSTRRPHRQWLALQDEARRPG